ncbi:Zn(II)2Cys6 transcription factor [Aspergillus ibericus CBS 121593]|uniref:Zn(2)-C6 fungal-type domain-containing protein n=1 Tax=Aspergillus ibericus CBS 121593 TaxID=1448316 RepID=A0A395H7S0_9EURO|nr:hypothetical protein BO80DRAFT_462404 [Aspergillus ibericus CBS 121593]RAL03710.1 hypothetical protein BO80DRAFT_462404 [Aspergillus ibericus CBS 121593]
MQPIAPAPPRTAAPSFSAPNASVPRLRKASVACRECKRTKARCQFSDGAAACDRCTKRHLSCTFDLDEDMRRKSAHKRKIGKLEAERNDLLQLVQTLQDSSDAKAMQLLDLIRTKAPLSELKLYMDHNISPPERETTPPLAVYNQTSTDDLVSHLISLWMTWSHPYYSWIDRELFLRDAQAGKPNSQFCSPFLVNCILAEACFHSDLPEVYADQNDPESKGVHFYEEARRLYETIEDRRDLPSIQGCGVLFVCMAAMGKDHIGWWYLGQVRKMAEAFTNKHPPPSEASTESHAVDTTLWDIYNLTATASISLMKNLAIDRPNRPHFPCAHRTDDPWVPYPRQINPIQSHIPCVLNSFTALSEINVHANRMVLASGLEPPLHQLVRTLKDVQRRLEDWKNKLPPCLTLDNTTVPRSLSLQ